jgi:hypothetical protein
VRKWNTARSRCDGQRDLGAIIGDLERTFAATGLENVSQ